MSCTFDLCLWFAPLSPMSSLALCLALFCTPFLAPWSCTLIHFFLHFYSYYVQNKYCIFTLFLKSLSLAPWACLFTICLAPSTPLSITCIVPLPCAFDFLYLHSRLQMSTLISCIFVFYLCPALPTPILHLWLACFKPTFYVFHHHLAPLNAELKYLHYTQCGHCCSCQHAYAILSMIFVYLCIAVAPCLCYQSVRSVCRMLMSKFLCYTQFDLCVLSTGVAPMLTLYSVQTLCRMLMSKFFRYTQYDLCVLSLV